MEDPIVKRQESGKPVNTSQTSVIDVVVLIE